MDTTVAVAPIGFLSHDGTSTIKGLVWEPERTRGSRRVAPRGVIQIVHGMVEHVGRYDEFARFLVEQGFVVCAADHIGHGKSVASADELGCLPVDGKETLIEDVHELRKTVTARYSRQTPYIMFGHSMGSFVTRAYLARHGEDVAAAVICGTGQQPLVLSKAGNALARFLAKTKGADYRSKLLHALADGAYSRAITDARTPFDWLSRDPAVADAFMADEACGFMFGAGAYAALTELAWRANAPATYRDTPHDLPLLFVSGDADPVGKCGKSVAAAAESMESAGAEDLTLRLFPGMRHEILNELGKQEVYDFILNWINSHN